MEMKVVKLAGHVGLFALQDPENMGIEPKMVCAMQTSRDIVIFRFSTWKLEIEMKFEKIESHVDFISLVDPDNRGIEPKIVCCLCIQAKNRHLLTFQYFFTTFPLEKRNLQ
jgi:hypothetical protein